MDWSLTHFLRKVPAQVSTIHYFQRGDVALKQKLYSVAFRLYLKGELTQDNKDYARSCQMALNDQLNKAELQELLNLLKISFEEEVPRGTLHYGLICNYLQNYEDAKIAYAKAFLLGVNEAKELMNQVTNIQSSKNLDV